MGSVGNRQSLKYGRWNQDMVESQAANNPAPSLSPLRGTFVGRQREMGELKAALDDALSGQGRLVMLVGEPGIGKTRTAQELTSYAETSAGTVPSFPHSETDSGTTPVGDGARGC